VLVTFTVIFRDVPAQNDCVVEDDENVVDTWEPYGLNVISSMAISFPIPPGALLVIFKTIESVPVGVVNVKGYCIHISPSAMLPVLPVPKTDPPVVSIEKVTLGKMPL